MVGVKGRPDPPDFAKAVKFFNGEGAEITVLVRVLALSQFRYHLICLAFHFFVACARIRQGTCREKMTAGEMTA